MDNIPVCITEKLDSSRCVGCGACINSCPTDALSYGRDPWGYHVPDVEMDKCVRCGKCTAVCPVYNAIDSGNNDEPECYAFINGDAAVVNSSSSGGAFSKFAQKVFQAKGVVYGASWNEQYDGNPLVRHIAARNEVELEALKKSKYMQSFIGYSLREIKNLLDEGSFVLFSGCPCQVAGLKSFLGKDYQNLFTVDILCALAPSEQFFRRYIEEKFGADLKSYEFRYKNKDWRCDSVRVNLKNGESRIYIGMREDEYQRVFHDHTMCSAHCENCIFHSVPRFGDITIGDFWGIMRCDSSIPGKNGVSVVLANSQKGIDFLASIELREGDYLRKVPISWLGGNGYTRKDSRNHASIYRDKFYENFLKMGFVRSVDIVEKESLYKEFDRLTSNYEVMRDWINNTDDNGNLSKKIIEKGYNSIAIYGMGDLGKMLYQKLLSTPVKVAYAIDRRPQKIDGSLKVISPNDELEPVDVIIVTVLTEFESIKNMLETKTNSKIIPLKEIF